MRRLGIAVRGERLDDEQNTYDPAGNVVTRVTNNGATTTNFVYDAAGRQSSSIVDPSGLNRTTTLAYDRDDNVVSTTQSGPNGTVGISEAMYDPMGRAIAKTTYPSTALTPVGRWKLDEGSGTTAADSSGNNKLTSSGVLNWSTERGGSAVFDGTSTRLTGAGPGVDAARSFTVAAWLNLADNTKTRKALSATGRHSQRR